MKVVVAAGGTAGHVVPALAVADELRKRGAEVSFIGGERAEAEMVPAAGYSFQKLVVTGLDRRNPLRAVRAVLLAGRAVFKARQLLRAQAADVVLAGGGYVAGPVGLAAWTLRIPLLITEADAHLGITNQLLAPLAKKVCLAFDLPGKTGRKYTVTGRPIAPRHGHPTKSEARRDFGLPAEGVCALIFGGSLGARTINTAAIDAIFDGLPTGVSVLHLTGKGDYQRVRGEFETVASSRQFDRSRYRLLDYTDKFDLALEAADVAICRAGGSIFELAAAGLPSILVPYPHATGDHQTKNARWLVDGGAALLLPDQELNGRSLRAVGEELLANPDRLEAMGSAARALAKPDAAADVAREILALAGERA